MNPYDFDPIEVEQLAALRELLREEWSQAAEFGFLLIAPRLVDSFGNHRTMDLARFFKTEIAGGRSVLRRSLETYGSQFRSLADFERRFPVTILPPRPAFPVLRIEGIELLSEQLFRVLDSKAAISGEVLKSYIARTGKLPLATPPRSPVRRSKPRSVHWCSYEAWESPEETREALQILPEWSDCRLRATIDAARVLRFVYLPINGDQPDAVKDILHFDSYYYEPVTRDHPTLSGGAVQVAVFGAPPVKILEKWNEEKGEWSVVWTESSAKIHTPFSPRRRDEA